MDEIPTATLRRLRAFMDGERGGSLTTAALIGAMFDSNADAIGALDRVLKAPRFEGDDDLSRAMSSAMRRLDEDVHEAAAAVKRLLEKSDERRKAGGVVGRG